MTFALSRQQLALFIKDHDSVRAFERLFQSVADTPETIEEVQQQAGNAAATAQLALDLLAALAETFDRISSAPVYAEPDLPDDTAPAVGIGSLGVQDHSAVEITGGTIDGTPIGGTVAASGTFTTFGCNGQGAQASAALGPAATDLASALTLLNSIRSALIANGIGS